MTVIAERRGAELLDWPRRLTWIATFTATACLLAYGYYLQYVEYLDPCPLCITQRLFYYAIGAVALVAACLPSGRITILRIAAGLSALAAIGGLATAGRQVWLQHLPADQVPECGPGLQYWLDNMPLTQTLALLFRGDGNCAEVHWRFLGLSIAEWSLAWFAGFFLLALWLFLDPLVVRARRRWRDDTHASPNTR